MAGQARTKRKQVDCRQKCEQNGFTLEFCLRKKHARRKYHGKNQFFSRLHPQRPCSMFMFNFLLFSSGFSVRRKVRMSTAKSCKKYPFNFFSSLTDFLLPIYLFMWCIARISYMGQNGSNKPKNAWKKSRVLFSLRETRACGEFGRRKIEGKK